MSTIVLKLNPHDRTVLATTIEKLIDLLDAIEPDADLEPWLGAPECTAGHGRHQTGSQERAWRIPANDDREDDGDDLEPSLGGMGTWGNGQMEYDLEGGENGETWPESEPSLGWPEQINQVARMEMKDSWHVEDGEEECEDEGAQCDDEGVLESAW